MEILDLLTDSSDPDLKKLTADMNRHVLILQGAAQVLESSTALLQDLITAFEARRSRAFSGWLSDNERAWCVICERPRSLHDTLPQLIEAYDLTDENYRASLAHSELADVCVGCLQLRQDRQPNASASRRFAHWDYDVLPVERRGRNWFVNRAKLIPDMSRPADGRGLRPCVIGPADWQPVGPGVPVRFTPEFVPDEYALQACLPEGIKLYVPLHRDHYTLAQGRRSVVFDGK